MSLTCEDASRWDIGLRQPAADSETTGRMPVRIGKGRVTIRSRECGAKATALSNHGRASESKVEAKAFRVNLTEEEAADEPRGKAAAWETTRSNAPTSAASIAERRPKGRSEAKHREARRGKEAEEGRTG